MGEDDRALAAQALRAYDVPVRGLVELARSFNAVFRVDTGGPPLVVRVGPARRIHRPGAADAEATFAAGLARAGLGVPRVLPAEDGSWSVRVTDRAGAGRDCTVLTWQPGVALDRPLGARDLAGLGELAARLHAASPPVPVAPPGVLDGRRVLLFELADRLAELAPGPREVLQAARDRAQAALDRLWARAEPSPRLVHGDLTPANVVRDGADLAVIDLQDVMHAHVEQDLAHTLYGIARGVPADDVLRVFRAAYERVRPWPALDRALLADLVAGRRVSVVNLAVHRERPDLGSFAARHADALRA